MGSEMCIRDSSRRKPGETPFRVEIEFRLSFRIEVERLIVFVLRSKPFLLIYEL